MKEILPPANSQEGLGAECNQPDRERDMVFLTRSQRDQLYVCFYCHNETQCLKCGNGMTDENDQPSLCAMLGLTPGEITMEDYHVLRRALLGESIVIFPREE